MEANENKQTIYDVFAKHNIEISSILDVLHTNLPFLKDGINLIVGESKAGKTFTTIQALIDNGFKDSIIHIDFDRNMDSKLKELNVLTYHINNVDEFLKSLADLDVEIILDSLKNKILVIDSLQDLSLGDGVDTNSGALATMRKVQGFKDTGATIILIHHVTSSTSGDFKVKGNSSVITSKADTTIHFTKLNPLKRIMKIINTRAEDKIQSGKEFIFGKQAEKGSLSVPK
jgi:RecA-family ATPase